MNGSGCLNEVVIELDMEETAMAEVDGWP